MENFNIDDYIDERITIYTTEDPLTGHIEVCEGYYDGGYMRFLLVDDAMQSAIFLEPEMEHELPFDYMESFNWIFTINKNIKRTLLIGGGGFAYPKYYLDMYPDKYIDAIEISKPVVETARAYFGLDELKEKYGDHVNIIIGDGNKYLIDLALRIREAESGNKNIKKDPVGPNEKSSTTESDLKYDVIINDAYVGHKSSDLLKKSAELVKACLKKDGIYVANMVVPLKGEGAKRSQKDMDVFADVFNYTFLLQCDEDINPYVAQNCVFFASDAPLV